jgi:hypothetical protein
VSVAIPLSDVADIWLSELARATGAPAIAEIDGATLLGERAMLGGFRIPARVSAGGGCRLYDCNGSTIALNLSRPADRQLLPALFEVDELDASDNDAVAALMSARDAGEIVARGREMGLAIAGESETTPPGPALQRLTEARPATRPDRRAPRVLDLSALWAGPLAAHLLWLAGAEVIKVESRTRPDAMRDGDAALFALLNQGKASVVLDLPTPEGRRALLSLIERSDVVIEAARPRALAQFGIDADAIVRTKPGLTWITITGHGAQGNVANWVGFGDDCGVAAGLASAMRAADGRPGFVGDAIADPLTGLRAAELAWRHWSSGRGGHIGLSMRGVVGEAIDMARARGGAAFGRSLVAWAAAAGSPFPAVHRRDAGPVPTLGTDTRAILHEPAPC